MIVIIIEEGGEYMSEGGLVFVFHRTFKWMCSKVCEDVLVFPLTNMRYNRHQGIFPWSI